MTVLRFYIDVKVQDVAELAAAALARAQIGATADEASEILAPGGEPDVHACIVMLLDPGASPPGLSIISSGVE